MDTKLTLDDLKNLTMLLARVDIKGSEALGLAILQQKLQGLSKEASQLSVTTTPLPEAGATNTTGDEGK